MIRLVWRLGRWQRTRQRHAEISRCAVPNCRKVGTWGLVQDPGTDQPRLICADHVRRP